MDVIDIGMTEKEWTKSIHHRKPSIAKAVLQCAEEETVSKEDPDPEEEESSESEGGGILQGANGADGEV